MDSSRHGNDAYASSSHHHHASGSGSHHQHQHNVTASTSSNSSIGGQHQPSFTQAQFGREDRDVVVQAIDRLGNKVGSQLSSLSVQLSSMLSLMSQLVEGQQRAQLNPALTHQAPSEGPSTWHQQSQLQSHPQAEPLSHTARQTMIRRDSGHPFAFDPSLDPETTTSFHPNPIKHSEQVPPHTADSVMTTAQPPPHHFGPSESGSMYMAHPGSEPSHSRQVSGAAEQPHASNHFQQPHHAPIPPPQASTSLDDSSMIGHSLSLDGMPVASGAVAPADASSPRRPASAYGSVRPFTAVDHSSRPAPPPAPPQPPPGSSTGDSHLPPLQEHPNADDQDRMRVDFELQQGGTSGSSMGYDASRPDFEGTAGSPSSFGRPPTRNPTQRHPLDPMLSGPGTESSPPGYQRMTDPDDSYHQPYPHHPAYPGQPSFSPYGSSPSKAGIMGLSPSASDDLMASRRIGRPPGPAIGALARKKSSRDTPLSSISARLESPQQSHAQQFAGAAPGGGGEAPQPQIGDLYTWAHHPPQPSETKLRTLPEPKWRTLQSARLDLQRKTGRTMAKLGRLPLKDYLEVSQPEYLAARKTGRAAYNEWLTPLVRLAKQDAERVKACTNFIEYSHPMLALCEGSFKARQLLQQIIDNAIDESTNAKKKAGPGGPGVENSQKEGPDSNSSQQGYERGETPDSSGAGGGRGGGGGATTSGGGGGGGLHSSFSSPNVLSESVSTPSYFPMSGGGDSKGDEEKSPHVAEGKANGTGAHHQSAQGADSDVRASKDSTSMSPSNSSQSIVGNLRGSHHTRGLSNGLSNGNGNSNGSPSLTGAAARVIQVGKFASPRSLTRGIHRAEPYSIAAKDR